MKLEIIITNSNWGSLLQVIEIVADAAKLTEVCHHTVGTETRTACLPHMVTMNFQTEIFPRGIIRHRLQGWIFWGDDGARWRGEKDRGRES